MDGRALADNIFGGQVFDYIVAREALLAALTIATLTTPPPPPPTIPSTPTRANCQQREVGSTVCDVMWLPPLPLLPLLLATQIPKHAAIAGDGASIACVQRLSFNYHAAIAGNGASIAYVHRVSVTYHNLAKFVLIYREERIFSFSI